MRFLIWAGVLMILVAGCSAQLGTRPALPTAIPGVSSSDVVFETAAPRGHKTQTPAGPTSTPAPWATELPPPPPPPAPPLGHVLGDHQDCLQCHSIGDFYSMPRDHARRSGTTCLGCHAVPGGGPLPGLTHPIAGREACLMCHLQGKNGAPVEPGDHAGRMNDTCLNCHKPK